MKNSFYLNFSTADHLGIGLFKYYLHPKERFIITNQTLVKILEYPGARELKKKTLGELFLNPKDQDKFYQTIRKDDKVKFFECLLKDCKGKPVWVAITASKVVSKDGKEHLEGIIEDISEHKQMEDSLALERDFLQGLLDNIPDAIYFKDRCNNIIKVNKFYAKGAGLSYDEIIGKNDFDFFPKDQAEAMLADDNSVLTTGKPIVGKVERTLLSDGSWNQVITTKIPMYSKQGEIIGTMGITRDMTAYANMERERLTMLVNALRVLGKALEMRDPYTFSHTHRVADIAERVGKTLNWDDNRLLGIKLAGELHDLGKISIPLDILNKPGKLSDLEYNLIKEHVQNCFNLIKDIEFPFPLAQAIYQHHELLDGSGYPRGLKGEEVIVEARVLAVSDVLEAMTNHRPYRAALGIEQAIEELRAGAGKKYDSQVVKVVENLVKENQDQPFWT